MLGSMGLALPIALGVALAQPAPHDIALEGDGSPPMQLGCLTTVAMLKPKNLILVVFDNGIYQITGGQPTPASDGADIVAIARGAGIAASAWAADEQDFEQLLDQGCLARADLIAARIDSNGGSDHSSRSGPESGSVSCKASVPEPAE